MAHVRLSFLLSSPAHMSQGLPCSGCLCIHSHRVEAFFAPKSKVIDSTVFTHRGEHTSEEAERNILSAFLFLELLLTVGGVSLLGLLA